MAEKRKVSFKPSHVQTVVPFIGTSDAGKMIEFMKAVFDAHVFEQINNEGVVHHAEVRIGDTVVMLGTVPGKPVGDGMAGVSLYVYVEDTASTYKKAIAAGATSVMEPSQQYYGDINGGVRDAFGNTWWIATHTEDVSSEELHKRSKEEFAKRAKKDPEEKK